MGISTSLFTSGSPAPLLALPPTSGSPVFLTPKFHFWLPAHTRRGSHQPWRTPKVVYTSRRGSHPKWSTPRGVVHTQCGLHLEAWSTPPAVAYTQSGLHHQPWSTLPDVAYTQGGLHPSQVATARNKTIGLRI